MNARTYKASARNPFLASALFATSLLLLQAAHAEDVKPGIAVVPVSSSIAVETPGALPSSAESALSLNAPGLVAMSAGATSSSSSDLSAVSNLNPSELPEAPSAVLVVARAPFYDLQSSSVAGSAPHYARTIPAGWTADRLSARDKVIIGARDLYSPVSFAGIALSAGYSHLVDGQPNYGVNSAAFGKRFGAGVLRSTSQGVFTDIVFSPLLHQDPRYYVEGPKYNLFHRAIYAATRPIIGRTDSGHSTVNGALLLGYAAAAALTPTYYPQINHNFHDVASTFGGSIGGSAIGFAFSEFSGQLFAVFHRK